MNLTVNAPIVAESNSSYSVAAAAATDGGGDDEGDFYLLLVLTYCCALEGAPRLLCSSLRRCYNRNRDLI